MSDLRLQLKRGDGYFYTDLSMASAQFEREDGLETAILLSLFTDARAADGTAGWWGNRLPTPGAAQGWQRGSLLHTLNREKATAETLRKAKEFIEAALAWLIEDGVASSVIVETAWQPAPWPPGTMAVRIEVTRTAGAVERFAVVWDAQSNRVAEAA